MKKFLASFMIFGFIFALGSPALAQESLFSLGTRKAVKCPDYSTTYYVNSFDERFVYPNEKIYFSWHNSFEEIETIDCEELTAMPFAGVVTYQAGTRLIKMPSVPKVYAVEEEGVLRPIKDEEQARKIYGDDWANRVDDIPEPFFTHYTLGDELEDDEIPNGTVVSDDFGGIYVFVDTLSGEKMIEVNELFESDDDAITHLEKYDLDLEDLEDRFEHEFEQTDFGEVFTEAFLLVFLEEFKDLILEEAEAQGLDMDLAEEIVDIIYEVFGTGIETQVLIESAEDAGEDMSIANEKMERIGDMLEDAGEAVDEGNLELSKRYALQALVLVDEVYEMVSN